MRGGRDGKRTGRVRQNTDFPTLKRGLGKNAKFQVGLSQRNSNRERAGTGFLLTDVFIEKQAGKRPAEPKTGLLGAWALDRLRSSAHQEVSCCWLRSWRFIPPGDGIWKN